jgi:hypothetical protein
MAKWNEKLSNELSKLKKNSNPTEAQIQRIYALEDIKTADGKKVTNPYPGRETNKGDGTTGGNNNGNIVGQNPANDPQPETGVLLGKDGGINKVAQSGPVDVAPAVQAEAATVNGILQDTTLSSQPRNLQMGLANQLQNQASGIGPSLADMQLKSALDMNQRQNLSLARSSDYINPAVAMRAAIAQNAIAGQQSAAMAAQARLAEQMQAREQLALLLNQTRTSDLGVEQGNQTALNAAAIQQAGFQQQANLTNAGATNNQVQFASQLAAQQGQFNAGQVNQATAAQAGLNTSAANTQRQTDASMANANTAANAQTQSAGIYANASMYAADNSLQAATVDSLLQNDQQSPGAPY